MIGVAIFTGRDIVFCRIINQNSHGIMVVGIDQLGTSINR